MISSIPKWVSNLFGNSMKPNVKVIEISYISQQIKRIRFRGDITHWNFQIGYASVVRVSETEFRNYTIAYHDANKGFFDIFFHIHGNGIGSKFIDTLKKDDEIFISLPRGIKLYEHSKSHQFFFGDETSLGVAFALLPLLKNSNRPFQFYFELDDSNSQAPELLGLENYTIFPKNALLRDVKWISSLPLFQAEEWNTASFALTGNVKSVQAFRKALKNKREGKIFSQGYWLEGKKGL